MEARDLTARSHGLTLAGSLWLPADRARAVVVMHPGSGPSDRHNDDLFAQVRPVFLAAGVAVASFDKRGVGGSDGDWRQADIEDQADDLLAAVAAAREAVPDMPAGVYGHSQGGWVAVEAGGRSDVGLAFVVSSSGPAVTLAAPERFALGRALLRVGVEVDADAVLHAYDRMVDGWRTAPDHATAAARLRAEADPAALAWLARVWPDDGAAGWELVRRLDRHDPGPVLARQSAPLLVLYGTAETVVPVAASVAALEVVRPDLLTVVEVPDGDHRLQRGDPPVLRPEVAPAITAFLDAAL